MKYFVILTLALTIELEAQVLIPIGEWRSHFNYQQTRLIVRGDNRVYCSTDNGLFFFDEEDNSINRITRTDGLSDINISSLAFSTTTEKSWLVIGYETGNIDLYSDDEIINLTQIISAQLTGSRRINHISVLNEFAYLSTDFGMVVLDLGRLEIRETYLNLGPAGERSSVYESVFLSDSIYLATDLGLIAGNVSGIDNLLDFQNWTRIISLPVLTESVDFVNVTDQSLLAGAGTEGIFILTNNKWQEIPNIDQPIIALNTHDKKVFISLEEKLISYDLNNQESTEINYSNSQHPGDVLNDEDGTIWIADQNQGLFQSKTGVFQSIAIAGPASNEISKIYFFEDQVYAIHGKFEDNIVFPSPIEKYSVFTNGAWEVISTEEVAFGSLSDLTGGISDGVKIVSFSDGLLDVSGNRVTNSASTGSPLVSSNGEKTLLSGVGFDSQGNLWVANYDSPRPLHKRDPQGNWTSFSFNSQAAQFPISLSINELDDVWMRLDPDEGGGILVFNDEEEGLINLLTPSNGDLPSRNVTDVIFDREDQVWIGTNQGIAFIPTSRDLFQDSGFDAIKPIFENRFLLEEEFITALAVDGGNRKWIGTKNGIWLFDPSGENLIANYTFDNSPLPDNLVIDIEVNPLTGEVFMATAKGLVSIRGTSTQGEKKHRNVKIFPNPVRPGFSGEIGISGLAEDAIVKITDAGGRLIWEVNASGGTAVWNARSFGGKMAETGIYLVFSSSQDGDETFVGKIAIVR